MVNVIPIIVGELGMVPKFLEKKTGVSGNQRKNRDHAEYNINIGLNSEKSLGYQRRLAVTQKSPS